VYRSRWLEWDAFADWFEATAWSDPNWAEVTAAVSTSVATLILIVTAIYAGRQLADARRTRDGALLVELSRRWDEKPILDSQELFAEYGNDGIIELIRKVYEEGGATDAEVRTFSRLEALPNLWETIGVLKEERAISVSVIDRMWGAAIIKGWGGWQGPIQRLRDATENQSSYEHFERLAEDLQEYRLRVR
jgi:hypothetical protein